MLAPLLQVLVAVCEIWLFIMFVNFIIALCYAPFRKGNRLWIVSETGGIYMPSIGTFVLCLAVVIVLVPLGYGPHWGALGTPLK